MIWRRLATLVVIVLVSASSRGEAGHEVPYYPSFYPQEIKIDALPPAAAATLLQKKSLHAYVGADPFAGTSPPHVTYAQSLKSYLVLTLGRPAALGDARARCAAAARAVKRLATVPGPYTFHPYPVTPLHDDYLWHFDRVEAERKHVTAAAPARALRIRARGPLAQSLLASSGGGTESTEVDATLEEIDVGDLLADRETRLNGWLGPPWVKRGWYHAYLLQASTLTDETARRTVEDMFTRRVLDPPDAAARANLERNLVAALGRGCERLVVGYSLRREPLNVEYSEGVENIAYDAQGGLGSPMFLRDVKLKDFPWNGWLRLGSAARPVSAWNPIAGFGDATGRLIWLAVGDPAFLPAPSHGGWVPNRVRVASSSPGPVAVPADALVPDATTGLRPAGQGTTVAGVVSYHVLASAFHHGTKMSSADLVYPFAFAARWGAGPAARGRRPDPVVARATAILRERLAGVRVVGVDSQIKDYGDLQVVTDIHRIDVYLKHRGDVAEAPVIAPPWSTIPWELTVLMEEAVTRGLAAFSESEARRHGVPWLDLARDARLTAALASLAETFERQAYVPEQLRGLITVAEARQRWAALRRFHRKHGHWLVTNGPYRLQQWSADGAVLAVFRDLSYPLAVGAYDAYALPVRAFATAVEWRGQRLEIRADVETVVKAGRSYKIERAPFQPAPAGERKRDTLATHYAIVNANDQVVSVGRSTARDGDRLVLDLPPALPPGAYRVLLALTLDDNLVHPEVTVVPYRVAD